MLPVLTSYDCILLIQNSEARLTYVFTLCKHPLLHPGPEPDLTGQPRTSVNQPFLALPTTGFLNFVQRVLRYKAHLYGAHYRCKPHLCKSDTENDKFMFKQLFGYT